MPSPVRIYAGTQEGLFVWRSKNGSWEKVSVAFETGTVDSVDGLKAQPNVVFLGVTQDGLYRTDDAGKSWRRVFEGNVRAVTVDPTNEEVVYVGAEPVHLYRSEDCGKSWEELTGVQELPPEVKKTGVSRAHLPKDMCAMYLSSRTIPTGFSFASNMAASSRALTGARLGKMSAAASITSIFTTSVTHRGETIFTSSPPRADSSRRAIRAKVGRGPRMALPATIFTTSSFCREVPAPCWWRQRINRRVIGTGPSAPKARSFVAAI